MIPVIAGMESYTHRYTLMDALSTFDSVSFEIPRHLVGVSYKMFVQRDRPDSYLSDMRSEGFDPIIYSGYHSDTDTSVDYLVAAKAAYGEFLERNVDNFIVALQFYNDRMPPELLQPVLDGYTVPILADTNNAQECEYLLSEFGAIAADVGVSPQCASLLRSAEQASPLLAHSAGMNLKKVWDNGFDSFICRHWYWASRYKQLLVWDGTKIRRFDSDVPKDSIIESFEEYIATTGLDMGKVLDMDAEEINKLALASYFSAITRFNALDPSTRGNDVSDKTSSTPASNVVDFKPRSATTLAPVDRNPRGKIMLPVLVPSHPDGSGVSLNEQDVRACDNCFLNKTCPEFEAGSTCKFDFPISIKTDDQVRDLMHAVIEMQAKRVAFARFAEELNGGIPDPVVGVEIDRLLKLSERVRQSEQRREKFVLSFESEQPGDTQSPGTAQGVLSRLFGAPQPAADEDIRIIEVADTDD